MRYFLEINYIGTDHHGWQRQNNAYTIQQAIEDCIKQVLQKEVKIFGSSRTDKGVHAQQQFAHVDLDAQVNVIQLHRRLNALLPFNIAIKAIKMVKEATHARFDATSRVYSYTIVHNKSPFMQNTSYWLRNIPSVALMNQATALLYGAKYFKNFSKNSAGIVSTYICNIIEAFWQKKEEHLIFTIEANRFLRGMVRIIVTTLLKVGYGRLCLSELESMLTDVDCKTPHHLVPACGLTLETINYPNDIFLPHNL